MVAFKKILSPTDFSDPSSEALAMAKELAARFKSELILYHVVDPWPGATSIPPVGTGSNSFDVLEFQRVREEEARNRLEKLAEAHRTPDIEIRTVLSGGKPADRIVEFAEDEDVDLIVISTHGVSGWRRFVFGSVAERVIRSTSRPVLSVSGEDE